MNAREVVATRLATQVERFPELDLAALDASGLDARDAALARAIEFAVVRHWLTLRGVLQSRLTRPWETTDPVVRGVLLAGAAQLIYLERIPAHAAIDESVEIAKRLTRGKATGIVNAVLRAVKRLCVERVEEADSAARDVLPLPDGRWWRLAEPILPAAALDRVAAQTSHPVHLLERWADRHGAPNAERFARHGIVQAPIIVAGLDATTIDAHADLAAHAEPGFAVYTGERAGLDDLLAGSPGARVQDPASAGAVALTAGRDSALIIDACAGRGTKTGQLAAMHPEARVVATDIHGGRRAALAAAFDGHATVEVVEPGALPTHGGRADLVVLDVPCSNTGVLPRRPEARYRFNDTALASLVDLQRSIIEASVGLVAPGGTLLYSTCSLEVEENQSQTAWMTEATGMTLVGEMERRPSGQPGDPATGYADGSYAALLELGTSR